MKFTQNFFIVIFGVFSLLTPFSFSDEITMTGSKEAEKIEVGAPAAVSPAQSSDTYVDQKPEERHSKKWGRKKKLKTPEQLKLEEEKREKVETPAIAQPALPGAPAIDATQSAPGVPAVPSAPSH